jgi:hypothetical protein
VVTPALHRGMDGEGGGETHTAVWSSSLWARTRKIFM